MLKMESIVRPTIVVSLGGLRVRMRFPIEKSKVQTNRMAIPYLVGHIGLIDPVLIKGREEARNRNMVAFSSRKTTSCRVDERPNPVEVLICAPEICLSEKRVRDFNYAQITDFDSNRLVEVITTDLDEQIQEILNIEKDAELFPDGGQKYTAEQIANQLWFLEMAAKVYADSPESIISC